MQINRTKEARNIHTIRELIDSFSGGSGRHRALNMRVGDSYQTLSYEELGRRVRSLGNGLLELGVSRGTTSGSSERTGASGSSPTWPSPPWAPWSSPWTSC